MEFIDMHTHIFNTKFFPVKGIFEKYLGIKSKLVLKAIELITTSYSEEAPSNFIETFDAPSDFETFFKSKDQVSLTLNELDFNNMDDKTLENALKKIPTNSFQEILTKKDKVEIILKYVFNGDKNEKSKFPPNLARWILYMIRPQYKIVQSLKQLYPQVNYFVNHIMDVDYNFGSKSKLSVEDQIKLTTSNTDDQFINFIGFHPFRQKPLELIEKAIKAGFKGVKYYTPLGHNPEGYYDLETYKYMDNNSNYKNLHTSLFELCDKYNLSIFIHTTESGGFGDIFTESNFGTTDNATKQARYNNSPFRWSSFLEKYKNVNVCFAHAGGEDGWFSNDISDKNYLTSDVIKTCQLFKNAYCELAFLNDIFIDIQKNKFLNNLKLVFKLIPLQVMYGSDWHTLMNEKVNGEAVEGKYLDKFIEIFKNPSFNEFENDFFYNNAAKYLNLKDSNNRVPSV